MASIAMSREVQKYFDSIQDYVKKAYKVARSARSKGFDPETDVEISLAKSLGERIIGIVSLAVPELSKAEQKILKLVESLEKEFGKLDWRVAFKLAEAVANEQFCKFENKIKAIEAGIRLGFAYITLGVVSSPLEGFVGIKLQKTRDGKDYFTLYYAGPVRNAGGTAAAFSVLLADYLRKKFGFAAYDATEEEVKRAWIEIEDYHNRVTNLQYFPSQEEVEFLVKHLPVQIAGEPSEKLEVSNYKDLPRIDTNRLRNGYCLVMAECLALKAPKLWNWIAKHGKDYDLEQWFFLKEFVELQKSVRSKAAQAKNDARLEKQDKTNLIAPDYNYLKDLVAGRPVLAHPSRIGGFRLRYGRTRTSGYSSQAIHPATMHVLNNFIATGTQLKVERPGKATAITLCDTIQGPVVKLKDGSVVKLNSEEKAKELKKQVVEIIYLGDLLISYGDFYNRAHPLIPAGYCEEWWALELEKALIEKYGTLNFETISKDLQLTPKDLQKLVEKHLTTKPSVKLAMLLSEKLNIPLHPEFIFYWKAISSEDVITLLQALKTASFEYANNQLKKIVMPLKEQDKAKQCLESIGLEHQFVNKEFVVINDNEAKALMLNLGLEFLIEKTFENQDVNTAQIIDQTLQKALESVQDKVESVQEVTTTETSTQTSKPTSSETRMNGLELVNKISRFKIRDKAGSFIGARMGRPEKAKPRKMEGSPNMLFPVGKEGGRMRSFNAAVEKGVITAEFKIYYCDHCKKEVVLPICEYCGRKARPVKYCSKCGYVNDCEHNPVSFKRKTVDAKQLLKAVRTIVGFTPELVKGVRGTSNADHTAEHPVKGFLRAKHELPVNKDGTLRFDASEVPITHFKPLDIGVSVEVLKRLGYEKDIYGNPLTSENQVLELKPQDVILPASPASPDEGCDEFLTRAANFVDELLQKVYGEKPFYNLKTKKDLIGHLVIVLAPHTSAGVVARIIGFSKTQGLYAHPMLHAGIRRDADGDEAAVLLLLDGLLNFSKHYLPASRGGTMDAPIVINPVLNPAEVDDMLFDLDIASRYPLQLYEACLNFQHPASVNVKQVRHVLGKEQQYEGYGFTHPNSDLNKGVLCSAYKLLPTMEEKLESQMDLARKIRAVDKADVARLVIEKHFLRDTKGNLRKFSIQQFRCVNCNAKFRRPPLNGKCPFCNGRIIFTISKGSIIKYLDFSLKLASQEGIDPYLVQTIELLKERIEGVFGKEQETQTGLAAFMKA